MRHRESSFAVFPEPGSLLLYLGKGNNAGDALVAAREFRKLGWRIGARLAFPEGEFKELPAQHWHALSPHLEPPASLSPCILLDGLLGIGASGPLSGQMRTLAAEMNSLRHSLHASTVAMDIPSGLNGDTGEPCADCVMADITTTVAHVKRGLLADEATRFVGRLAVVPLSELASSNGETSAEVLTPTMLRGKLPRRSFDFHKGQAGRVGILAGSRGFIGAAVLAATGALRGGAGLVSLFVKEEAYPFVVAQAPVEVMVRMVKDYREVLAEPFDVLAIGPGLGFHAQEEILDVILQSKSPAIIDADALTMIARADGNILAECAAPRLLTPHPGEMSRLIQARPEWQDLDRRSLAEAFVRDHPHCTLLLKGARTVIAQSGTTTCFNTTGTPGMASGGMGDVLTGLCAALIAQSVTCHHAACLGAWLSGRAAEIAISTGSQSIESLTAGDVLDHLGAAFGDLKASCEVY